MADNKVKVTKETQKRIIALARNLGVDAKTELAPEWKKIYQEDYIQAHKEKHGEDAAQSMAVEVLTARYYTRVLREDNAFMVQLVQAGIVKLNKDKEQYLKMTGWCKRLDSKGGVMDAEPLLCTINVKGDDNISKFSNMKDGDRLRTTFGVMNKTNYSLALYRAPENMEEIEYDQDQLIDPAEMADYAAKIAPLINVAKVADYTNSVVAIWARPVLRASTGGTKDVGVYEIIDDSVDKEFLLQYKALTIFTTRKYVDCGPGSIVLFVLEIMKPQTKGNLPSAQLVMHFPGDMVTPVMAKDTKPIQAADAPAPVTDEDLEDTGLELL